MTVYNGAKFLRPAIDSILNQTFSDFHFLIIDDASTDDSPDIVRSYQDDRIKFLLLDKNVGQTAALNKGLEMVCTKWIARMDADDYSAPSRLEQQMGFLSQYPYIGVLGTHAWTFYDDPSEFEGEILTAPGHDEIAKQLLNGSPLIHSSFVALRDALLECGGYQEKYKYAADVELYDRLFLRCNAANLQEKLYGIRIHEGQGVHTTVAIDEIIDIYHHRLSEDHYSNSEKYILKSALSRRQIILAYKLFLSLRLVSAIQNLCCAANNSPRTFLFYLPTVFIGFSLPRRIRRILKRAFLSG